eukprot:10269455-Alexandrium_andersonii.AAC.1
MVRFACHPLVQLDDVFLPDSDPLIRDMYCHLESMPAKSHNAATLARRPGLSACDGRAVGRARVAWAAGGRGAFESDGPAIGPSGRSEVGRVVWALGGRHWAGGCVH